MPSKVRTGIVVSNKMDKTIVVRVERMAEHPLYGKRIKRAKKYVAHDAENQCGMGDEVKIRETRPLSKTKRWELAEIMRKAPVFGSDAAESDDTQGE
ncbi:MAG: 30S ribosomal protein S17 [Synergistaceae bacterium]|nr:30S ribosomal protein S17 [Synergistaceae bacterium]MBQ3764129.1 30S ribosomal protein S17 [Synergistaceae bacterium]MBQ6112671.1 30S ribosomal protein S17 [Synergistaceae bacterium]MBQ6919600.1 30S ribosomal protein S17 [Synergistaceae bacterium]MBQ7266876.1 30S ribosomal protein S17 [Synergistaceae bacterium]